MNNQQPIIDETEEVTNPLLFWVAYMPGEGNEKKYLSDGKGNLRIYKTEGKMRKYLEENLPQSDYEKVVVHSVQGQIVLPEDETALQQAPAPTATSPLRLPINTLAADMVPTAMDLLRNYKPRRRKK